MTQSFDKKEAERGVVRSLLAAMSAVMREGHYIVREGEAPDFVCQRESGEEFGVEITAVYYSSKAAKALWSSTPDYVTVVNPDQTIADGIEEAVKKKARSDYGKKCLLAIHLDAPLTTTDDFEDRILPSIEIASDRFVAVFCRLKATAEKSYGLVWWQLYPQRKQYFREPRMEEPSVPSP